MYSTCLFCHTDLGTNEAIESFPIGRRLAFDAATGRLWVICRKCERWNLTPIEERWEAVEQCERLFSSTRMRVSSDNIGLSRLREGLELVRIGRPLRPEMAAWRYGDQFGRRRRRYIIGTATVGVAAAGVLIVGPATGLLAGGGFGVFQLLNGLRTAAGDRIVRARVAIPGRDRPTILRRKDLKRLVLGSKDGDWTLTLPYNNDIKAQRSLVTLSGAEALRAAAAVLPAVNVKGATRNGVNDAVYLLERTPDARELFLTATKTQMTSVRGIYEVFLDRLPQPVRLALEMAAHEDIERRAMEGELSMLEQAWREAEEIAAISDSMFLTEDVDEKFSAIRQSEQTKSVRPRDD